LAPSGDPPTLHGSLSAIDELVSDAVRIVQQPLHDVETTRPSFWGWQRRRFIGK
jgi:hypothetical protein